MGVAAPARLLEGETLADDRETNGATSDIELFEMANLSTNRTGVDGVVYISTAQGGHGPRVQWYPGRPATGAPSLTITIEPAPKVINHCLPARIALTAADAVTAWVALNHDQLLDFWNNGTTWLDDEIDSFKARLKPLS